MGKRQTYDWEAIEREYRAGQLSISEIAARFGCARETVSRKVTKEGWTRDLAGAVRKAVAEKVTKITSQVTDPNVTEKEIIEGASDRGVDVLMLHRKDIQALRGLEAKLIEELKGNPTKLWIGQYQGQVVTKEVGLTAAERAQAANNLANVQHKRIALERQAFNLNDSGLEDPDAPDSILIKVNRGQDG